MIGGVLTLIGIGVVIFSAPVVAEMVQEERVKKSSQSRRDQQ